MSLKESEFAALTDALLRDYISGHGRVPDPVRTKEILRFAVIALAAWYTLGDDAGRPAIYGPTSHTTE